MENQSKILFFSLALLLSTGVVSAADADSARRIAAETVSLAERAGLTTHEVSPAVALAALEARVAELRAGLATPAAAPAAPAASCCAGIGAKVAGARAAIVAHPYKAAAGTAAVVAAVWQRERIANGVGSAVAGAKSLVGRK